MPEHFLINDNMVVAAGREEGHETKWKWSAAPTSSPSPWARPWPDTVTGKVLLKMEDNITTDHIMPSGAKLLPYRSNIPYLSRLLPRRPCDPAFPARAKAERRRASWWPGRTTARAPAGSTRRWCRCTWASSAVIAKSFARIHRANLINTGILPLTFANEGGLRRHLPHG